MRCLFFFFFFLGKPWPSINFSSKLRFLFWYAVMDLISLSEDGRMTTAKDNRSQPTWMLEGKKRSFKLPVSAPGENLAEGELFVRFSSYRRLLWENSVKLDGSQRSPRVFGMTLEVFPDWQASTVFFWTCWGLVFDLHVTKSQWRSSHNESWE